MLGKHDNFVAILKPVFPPWQEMKNKKKKRVSVYSLLAEVEDNAHAKKIHNSLLLCHI